MHLKLGKKKKKYIYIYSFGGEGWVRSSLQGLRGGVANQNGPSPQKCNSPENAFKVEKKRRIFDVGEGWVRSILQGLIYVYCTFLSSNLRNKEHITVVKRRAIQKGTGNSIYILFYFIYFLHCSFIYFF